MRLISSKMALAALLTIIFSALPMAVSAQPAPAAKDAPAKNEKEKAVSKMRPIPFRGKLSAVDKAGRTITVGARMFKIGSDTKLAKGTSRVPATLNDAVMGEEVTGSYVKDDSGKLTARSVYFGTRAPSKGEEKKDNQGKTAAPK